MASTYAKPKLNMTITTSLLLVAILRFQSHGIGRATIAVSRTRLREMDDISVDASDLQ